MSNRIITPGKIKEEEIMNEINTILNKYGKALAPEVKITPGGIGFIINIVDKVKPAGIPSGIVPGGARGGGPNGG